jgi:Ni/Co efflux regulator RcnB
VSQNAADRNLKTRRAALLLLAAAPFCLAEAAHAQGRGNGRGEGRGAGRGERRGGGRDDFRRFERERPRYDDDRRGGRNRDFREYDDGPPSRYGRERGRVLPPQDRGGRIDNYERYRLRQPPRGYSWYRSGDGFALVGPNGVVFDVID